MDVDGVGASGLDGAGQLGPVILQSQRNLDLLDEVLVLILNQEE